jgi:hypothetical protein
VAGQQAQNLDSPGICDSSNRYATPDPGNQLIVAIPLILLLELSIFLSRFVYKKRTPPAQQEAEA